ncbi:hypothetical protein D1P53_001701 [Cryptococcus gattii VGV]|nr:hypothetical protein D1P53_001701 [Cryptococcus gattii VGV]
MFKLPSKWNGQVGSGSIAIANKAQDSQSHSCKPMIEWYDKWCYHHKSPMHHTWDCPNKPGQTGSMNLVSGNAEDEVADFDLVLHTTADLVGLLHNTFIVNSGASHHMVAYESLLLIQHLNPPSAVKHVVKLGDGCIVPNASQGQTCLGPVTLDKALLVLDLTFNTAKLIDPTMQTTYLSTPWEHNSYLCCKASSSAHTLVAPVTDDLLEWHMRFGHLSVQKS